MKVFVAVLSLALVACALGQELYQTPGEIYSFLLINYFRLYFTFTKF
jgi:hypothetical protein